MRPARGSRRGDDHALPRHMINRVGALKARGMNLVVVDTPGDSFFVAFPRAAAAIEAVVQAQRALAAHTWPQGVAKAVAWYQQAGWL